MKNKDKLTFQNWFGGYLDIDNLNVDKVKHNYIIVDDDRDYLVVDDSTGELKGTHNTYKSAHKQKKILDSWIT